MYDFGKIDVRAQYQTGAQPGNSITLLTISATTRSVATQNAGNCLN
jgi:hypothetical protein